jgi:hypothetical protein
VTLTWPAGVGATGYNIKRSLVLGGPYTVIGTSAASPYVDLTAVNGTTYYYVVSSTNSCGESTGNSLESHGTPTFTVVSNWVSRVQANGGALPSLNTTNALSTFVQSLVACGIDGLMVSVNTFVPDSLIAALTPLYVGGGNDPWTNNNFVAGDLSVAGLVGDGATKYLDTGCVPSVVLPNDTEGGLTIYIDSVGGAAQIDIGSDDGVNYFRLVPNFGGAFYYACWDNGLGRAGGLLAPFAGFVSGSRINVASSTIYLANSVTALYPLVSINTTGGTRPALSIWCFGNNDNGALQLPTADRLSFSAIHRGLSAVETLCFFNAVQALRVALGGGFTPLPVVILPDGSGGFWNVVVDTLGNVYTQSIAGPATPDVILADGGGGFWKLTADALGDRYGVSNAGPATVAPVILDSNSVAWTLTVDALGDITATS